MSLNLPEQQVRTPRARVRTRPGLCLLFASHKFRTKRTYDLRCRASCPSQAAQMIEHHWGARLEFDSGSLLAVFAANLGRCVAACGPSAGLQFANFRAYQDRRSLGLSFMCCAGLVLPMMPRWCPRCFALGTIALGRRSCPPVTVTHTLRLRWCSAQIKKKCTPASSSSLGA